MECPDFSVGDTSVQCPDLGVGDARAQAVLGVRKECCEDENGFVF